MQVFSSLLAIFLVKSGDYIFKYFIVNDLFLY
jgi:hypothetical protein